MSILFQNIYGKKTQIIYRRKSLSKFFLGTLKKEKKKKK